MATPNQEPRVIQFQCDECKPGRLVHIVHEREVDAVILGLPGKGWLRTYSCGHQYKVLEHSSRYRTNADRGR